MPDKLIPGKKRTMAYKKGPFRMKGSPMKDKTGDAIATKKSEEADKKKRAIKQGKIANWNKANPNASQEEMNAYITSLN